MGEQLGATPMKMNKADFELWHASIMEQWEAKRLDNREAADMWRLDEVAKLYDGCGWTHEEIGVWFGELMARRIHPG
jgi:hypothetical protein